MFKHLILLTSWSLLLTGSTTAASSGVLKALFRGSQQKRALQVATIDVKFTWELDLGDIDRYTMQPSVDREPKLPEYYGVVAATEAWLSNAFSMAFGDNEPDSVACELGSKSWTPSTTATDYPHSIQMTCGISTAADVIGDITGNAFVLELDQTAKPLDFMKDFNPKYGPSNSLMHSVTRAAYIMEYASPGTATTVGTETTESTTTTTDPSTGETTTTVTSETNVAIGSNPTTTSDQIVASVSPDDFENLYRVPLEWTWYLSLDSSASDRVATSEDFYGLVQATENWLNQSMYNYFALKPFSTISMGTDAEPVPQSAYDYVNVTLANGTAWDESAANFTHIVPLRVETYFGANQAIDVPTAMELIDTMRTNRMEFSTLDFLQQHLKTIYNNADGTSSAPNYLFGSTSGLAYQANVLGLHQGPVQMGGGQPQLVTVRPEETAPGGSGSMVNQGQPGTTTAGGSTTGGDTSTGGGTTMGGSATVGDDWTVTVRAMSLRYNTGAERSASPEEWDGIVETTIAFLQEELSTYYNSVSDMSFVKIEGDLVSTEYQPDEPLPQLGKFDWTLTFEAPEMQIGMMTYQILLVDMFNGGSMSYVTQYVRKATPDDSIFHETTQFSYGFERS